MPLHMTLEQGIVLCETRSSQHVTFDGLRAAEWQQIAAWLRELSERRAGPWDKPRPPAIDISETPYEWAKKHGH